MNKSFCFNCDRCSKVLGHYGFEGQYISIAETINFVSKKKKTKMHFCNEKCKITFLKGKKYYNKKVRLQQEAITKNEIAANKCL